MLERFLNAEDGQTGITTVAAATLLVLSAVLAGSIHKRTAVQTVIAKR